MGAFDLRVLRVRNDGYVSSQAGLFVEIVDFQVSLSLICNRHLVSFYLSVLGIAWLDSGTLRRIFLSKAVDQNHWTKLFIVHLT